MRLQSKDLSGIGTFLGYGNPTAKIWFVGGEEGFGGRMSEDERLDSLVMRASWSPIRDMYEAHLELMEAGQPIDISKPRKGSVAVWRWMARIYLVLAEFDYEEAKRRDREYVYNRLGRTFGETFLTEVSPFPCVTARKPHPAVAIAAAAPNRQRTSELRKLREATDPLLICYGLGRRHEFRDLFDLTWTPLDGFGGRVLADTTGRAFLLPFFGQGQMSHELARQFCNAVRTVD